MSNTYTDVFTGGPINPTPTSEAKYVLTESITLSWPQSGIETSNIVANIMEISTTNGAYTITMPDATMVSVGQSMIFRNIGSVNIDILKNDGSALATISATPEINVVWLYVNDNSTVPGGWGVMNYGTATSSADAATLAGNGLIAISTTLNVDMETVDINTDYDITADDRGKLIVWTSGNGDINLPSSESVGNGFIVSFKNRSNVSGQFTLVPQDGDNIDTYTNGYTVSALESLSLVADGGSSWNSVGFGKDTIFAVNILNLNINSFTSSSYTLSSIEASKLIINLTGTLTQSITIFFPPTANQYYIANNTIAAGYTLTIQTSGGSLPYDLPAGQRYIFYCDGFNLYPIPTTIAPGSLVVPDGSAETPGLPFSGDPYTGIYLPGDGEFGITTGGVSSVIFTYDGVEVQANGTEANPSFTFQGSTNSGLYLTPNQNVSITFQGARVAEFDSTGINTNTGTVSAPSYAFIGRDDVGIYSSAAHTCNIASNGVDQLVIDNTQATFTNNVNFLSGISIKNGNQLSLYNTANTFSTNLGSQASLAANYNILFPITTPSVGDTLRVASVVGNVITLAWGV